MNMKNYLDEIEILSTHFGFDKVLSRETKLYKWFGENEENLCEAGYSFSEGTTRGIITHDNWDYVFKFNLYTEEDTNHPENYIDHCKNEVFIYEMSKRYKLDTCFAACFYLGKFLKTDIYVMEKCDCNYERISDSSCELQYKKYCLENNLEPDSEKSRDEFYDCFCCSEWEEEDYMFEYADDILGIVLSGKLYCFLKDYYVNDCHCGNWGMIGGSLVLVDYAGYGDGARKISKLINEA